MVSSRRPEEVRHITSDRDSAADDNGSGLRGARDGATTPVAAAPAMPPVGDCRPVLGECGVVAPEPHRGRSSLPTPGPHSPLPLRQEICAVPWEDAYLVICLSSLLLPKMGILIAYFLGGEIFTLQHAFGVWIDLCIDCWRQSQPLLWVGL